MTVLRNLLPKLGNFFRWWIRELLELLPKSLRRRLWPERALLVTLPSETTLQIWRFEEGELESVASLSGPARRRWRESVPPALRRWPLELVLLPNQGLRTVIKLPAAAAENLRQVLTFELDQYTPWTAEQAYFDFQWRRCKGEKIEVELVVIPRARLDALLELLRAIDLHPQRIDMARWEGNLHQRYEISLLPEKARPPSSTPALPLVVTGVLLVSVMAASAMPLVMNERLKRELKAQIETLLPKADRTLRLKRRVLEQQELLMRIQKAIAKQPPMVLLLDDLARKLPQHTHITMFRYRRREQALDLTGLSGRAAELIAKLEASPYLEALQFTTAITRDHRGKERFKLQGKVVSKEPK